MTEKKKTTQKIELPAARKATLAETFGVTPQFVGQALAFKRNSPKAERIRVAALREGGRLVRTIDVTDELRKAVKVLDTKGNVIRTIEE